MRETFLDFCKYVKQNYSENTTIRLCFIGNDFIDMYYSGNTYYVYYNKYNENKDTYKERKLGEYKKPSDIYNMLINKYEYEMEWDI